MDYAALSAEDLILACTRTGDAAAWEEFVRRFHRLIATVAWRVAGRWGDVSPQVIDDLVQETYLKLCADNSRILRSFKPNHSDAFCGFLKTVTANLVHDYFKAAHSAKRGSGMVELTVDPQASSAADVSDSSAAVKCSEREIELHEFDAMLRKCLKGRHLKRDCRIFWLYYRVGLTASDIATLPSIGLNTKGVESTILRLTRLLRQEVGERRARKGEGQT
jgi:RNA polymerase sigma-70 factor (ECF subfamily)